MTFLRRIQFFWWGRFRGYSGGFPWNMWLQWTSITMCTDKDWSLMGHGRIFGPLQITWWDRPDWRDFCYTKEESAEVDRQEREEMRQWRLERESENGSA